MLPVLRNLYIVHHSCGGTKLIMLWSSLPSHCVHMFALCGHINVIVAMGSCWFCWFWTVLKLAETAWKSCVQCGKLAKLTIKNYPLAIKTVLRRTVDRPCEHAGSRANPWLQMSLACSSLRDSLENAACGCHCKFTTPTAVTDGAATP